MNPKWLWRTALLGAAAVLWAGAAARADSRTEHPLQFQLDQGVSIGYHLSAPFYVGIGVGGPRVRAGGMMDRGGGMMGRGGDMLLDDQPGLDKVSHTGGGHGDVELRWSPWDFGLYFAGAAVSIAESRSRISYESRARLIGNKQYATALTVDVTEKAYALPALGVGFNHVFPSGLSLGAGFLLGLDRPPKPQVAVSASDPTVDPADLALLQRDYERQYGHRAYALTHLAIGWNF
jgi:hypothetical protein